MHSISIAIQGCKGSFSHMAVEQCMHNIQHFHEQKYALIEARTLQNVFSTLSSDKADTAVIPITNSIAGDVPNAKELIDRHQYKQLTSFSIKIEHNLIVHPQTDIGDIKTVTSHPMALKQCQTFLSTIQAKQTPHNDTAGSVADIMRNSDYEE